MPTERRRGRRPVAAPLVATLATRVTDAEEAAFVRAARVRRTDAAALLRRLVREFLYTEIPDHARPC